MTDQRLQEYWTSTTDSNLSGDGEGSFSAGKFRSSSDEPASDAFARGVKSIEQFLGSHPRLTVAVAVTLGVTFGWWVKRK
ncbi:MAG: hypothetical protein RH917_19500 [Lacipirellulaceae bacterium]